MLIILEDNLQNFVPWATYKVSKICAALMPPPLHHHHQQQQQQRRRRRQQQQQQHSQTNHIYMLSLTESLSHTAPSSLTSRTSDNSKTRSPYLQHHTSHSGHASFQISLNTGTNESNSYLGVAVCPHYTAVFRSVTLIHGMPALVVDYNASVQQVIRFFYFDECHVCSRLDTDTGMERITEHALQI